MTTYYPVIITVAMFIAIVMNDVISKTPERLTINALQGFVCVLLMLLLSFKNMELISWGLLVLFFIILIICYRYAMAANTTTATEVGPAPVITPILSTPIDASGSASMISVPVSPTMSAQVKAAPYTFTPITGCSKI